MKASEELVNFAPVATICVLVAALLLMRAAEATQFAAGLLSTR
jgi:hypothetical protein